MPRTQLILISSLLVGCAHGSDRHRLPITGTTPVTTDEKSQFVAHATALGCHQEPSPDGEDSVYCPNELGKPRFVWLKAGGMACGVKPRFDASCDEMWKKLNTP